MPWWIGVLIGLIAYVVIRHGIGWYLTSSHNPVLSGIGQMLANGAYAPFAWLMLIACWIAAIASFIGRGRRRQLLDNQTGIESLRQMSWRQFKQLTGEAFRRQGYAVEETGLGGADGGIDLKLRKDGKTTLVQSKQWRNRQISVNIVREMLGVLIHERADAVIIVALGNYTADARRFAHGKPIELIPGDKLIATVRSLQTRKTRGAKPMDTPLALSGSMAASLLLIAILTTSASTAPSPMVPSLIPAVTQGTPESPSVLTPHLNGPSAQPTSYVREYRNDALERDWKKRNAESMKILEKTTKEMPLR
jgi:restriction system protein